ncbi:hypothetical protein F5141DRAFT_1134216 [Pisolithus sp. B1]|nr:hypothetical protein F5141DRAFT_1134216 [Pisolithus sp. B1]
MRMRRPHAAAVLFVFSCVSCQDPAYRDYTGSLSPWFPDAGPCHFPSYPKGTSHGMLTRPLSFPPGFIRATISPLCTPHPRTQHVTADIF